MPGIVKMLNNICRMNNQNKRNNKAMQNSAEDLGLSYSEEQ